MTTKEKVLEVLERGRGTYVSGEMLAAELHASRAAVWKAITALRAEGYQIQGVNKRGYALSGDTDRLTAAGIGACLSPALSEKIEICAYDSVDSTNNEAKRRIAAGMGTLSPDRALLIVAERQTAGRGRMGRSFYSPGGSGLYMSFVFTAAASLADAVGITGAASVAVVRAIRACTGKEAAIKWVNDVLLDGKKVCGILTEAVTSLENGHTGQIVVGIGINCGAAEFPEEVASVAGSVGEVRRCALCAAVTEELYGFMQQLTQRPWMEEYRRASAVLGKEIRCIQGEHSFLATALEIDESGGLVVRRADGTCETLHSGEISIRFQEKS